MGTFLGNYWPELIIGAASLSLLIPWVRDQSAELSNWWFTSVSTRIRTTSPILAAAAAVAVQVVYGNEPTPTRIHGATASAVLTAIAVSLPLLYQASAEKVAEEAIERINYDFGRTLQPLTAAIREVSEATGIKKQQAKGSARTVALTAASTLVGGAQDIRANYYLVSGDAPNRKLSPAAAGSVGRPDVSRSVFVESTQIGRTIFEALDDNGWAYCESIESSPPLGWSQTRKPLWSSFMSVPVVSKGKVIGMLTADSKLERDFNPDQDPYLLFTIAHLLAVAEQA